MRAPCVRSQSLSGLSQLIWLKTQPVEIGLFSGSVAFSLLKLSVFKIRIAILRQMTDRKKVGGNKWSAVTATSVQVIGSCFAASSSLTLLDSGLQTLSLRSYIESQYPH
jgi:hypothetical protein